MRLWMPSPEKGGFLFTGWPRSGSLATCGQILVMDRAGTKPDWEGLSDELAQEAMSGGRCGCAGLRRVGDGGAAGER
jgi:hypothetical protein